MAGGGESKKAVVAALLANAGIAVAKFVAFLITASSSMLAESVHSVADSGNQGLLLFGSARAKRRATAAHPFGYGRERYFWAFVVTLVLFTLGAVFAMYEGIEKIRHPHEVTSPAVAIGVLVVAVMLETWSLRTAVQEANKVRGEAGWVAFIRHSKNPELPVVLLEDIGAEAGLFLALGGVTMSLVTGNANWDAYATISIGVLLGVIAVVLAIEMKSLLIGEGGTAKDLEAIRGAVESTPGVERVIHLRTLHLGPDELLVGAKLAMDSAMTVEEVATTINAAESTLRARVPIARVVYLEPDLLATAAPAPEPA